MNRTLKNRIVSALVALAVVSPSVAASPAPAAWPTDVPRLAHTATRASGADRYAAAATIAGQAYPGWAGVSHVVVASGDDRASADPLAAASLCWAYDAPLLLTSAKSTPGATKAALAAIVSANTTVTVHVVGGTVSVPSARVRELRTIAGAAGTVEQPWTSGTRFGLAAGIAARTRQVAADTARVIPSAAFVANGDEATRFFDALAASAVSRNTGIPVLLTKGKSVPAETLDALKSAGNPETIVIGGPLAVTDKTAASMGADGRWYGQNRYGTASAVARGAIARGWSTGAAVGLAAKIPDALAGASAVGRTGGVVLTTGRDRLEKEAYDYLIAPSAAVATVTALGGPASIADAQVAEVQGYPAMAYLGASTPGSYVGKTMQVSGFAGSNTRQVALYVGGAYVASRQVTPFGAYDFGSVTSPSKSAVVEIRASNPDGQTSSATRKVERLVYPYATCIVIDKSDFKLFWVKNNRLVKVYPIATGRAGMDTPAATWKILAKYKTDPSGVYGPRKMRLFRKSGSSFVYTAYGIHGTNQPWVIGTKASHGCIRMYNKDVLELWPQVPIGTMVITRN